MSSVFDTLSPSPIKHIIPANSILLFPTTSIINGISKSAVNCWKSFELILVQNIFEQYLYYLNNPKQFFYNIKVLFIKFLYEIKFLKSFFQLLSTFLLINFHKNRIFLRCLFTNIDGLTKHKS